MVEYAVVSSSSDSDGSSDGEAAGGPSTPPSELAQQWTRQQQADKERRYSNIFIATFVLLTPWSPCGLSGLTVFLKSMLILS